MTSTRDLSTAATREVVALEGGRAKLVCGHVITRRSRSVRIGDGARCWQCLLHLAPELRGTHG